LKASVGTGVLHVRLADPLQREAARQILAESLAAQVHPEADPKALAAQLSDPSRATAGLVALAGAGIAVSDFSLGQPSLDEVFFALTGHAAAENGDSTAATRERVA
jgi:ABC-2 type transport system ATP-binding protein